MGANPIPLYWQGQLAADTTQRVKLLNTLGLFVQAIIVAVDNGDIQISGMNFVKQRPFVQLDGTANITQRGYQTVQNQVVFPFYNGIVLQDDIAMTLFENGSADTEFSITVIPARRESQFQPKGFPPQREGRFVAEVVPPPWEG